VLRAYPRNDPTIAIRFIDLVRFKVEPVGRATSVSTLRIFHLNGPRLELIMCAGRNVTARG